MAAVDREPSEAKRKIAEMIADSTGTTPEQILKTSLPLALYMISIQMFLQGELANQQQTQRQPSQTAEQALNKTLALFVVTTSVE